MNQERLLKVLVAPVISEKSTMVAEKLNQACFVVVPDANKAEVKAAVELLFKVQVKSVQILNLKGKQKRFGRFMGKRNDVRKAYVTLDSGSGNQLRARGEVMALDQTEADVRRSPSRG